MPGNQTVEERIVEMRIDNKNFESGAKKTISTLEKLDKALKLDGSGSDAIQKVSDQANRFNANPMIQGLQQVQNSFSALETVGTRVIENLTDSVYRFTANTIKSFTVDPIAQGFGKYGEKTTSVATLTAQGYALEKVNQLMEDLNWFTDETSYNFTDMVGNIAKFTATGQDLDQSVTAMEGIALWAALSGQNASKASMAMYQLSQAMGKGALKYDDYKSIQNASMDTQEFRQKAVEAAEELGVLKKTAEGTWEVLSEGKEFDLAGLFSSDALSRTLWFNSDVMMNVFNKYSKAVGELGRYMEENGFDTASVAMDDLERKAKDLAATAGITLDEAFKQLGYDIDEFSLKAFRAGQQARTWGDVVDSVKDAVSTGWMTTFEYLFGNAEKATKLWTELANRFYDIFAEGGNTRNEILKSAFGTDAWTKLTDLITATGNTAEQFESVLSDVASESGVDIGKIIAEAGSLEEAFKRGELSIDLVRNAFKRLGGSKEVGPDGTIVTTTRSMADAIADVRRIAANADQSLSAEERLNLAKEYGLDEKTLNIIDGNIRNWKGTLADKWLDEYITNLLTANGFVETTTENIANSTAETAEYANDIDAALNHIYNNKSMKSGGDMLFEVITNLLDAIQNIQGVFRTAFENVFGDTTERGERLYGIIEKIYEFSSKIGFSGEQDEETEAWTNALGGLQRILEAIFRTTQDILYVAAPIVAAIARMVWIIPELVDWMLRLVNGDASFSEFFTIIKNGLPDLSRLEMLFWQIVYVVTSLPDAIRNVMKFLGMKSRLHEDSAALSNAYNRLTDLERAILRIAETLQGVGPRIRKTFSNLLNSFERVGQFLDMKKRLHEDSSALRHAYDRLSEFEQGLVRLAERIPFLGNIFKGIKPFFQGVGQVFAVIGGFIAQLIGNIPGLSSISEFFTNLFDTITGALPQLPKFEGIGEFFSNLYETFLNLLSRLPGFENVREMLSNLFGSLGELFSGMKLDVSSAKTLADKIAVIITAFFQGVGIALSSISLWDVFKAVGNAIKLSLLSEVVSVFYSLRKTLKAVRDVPESISDFFGGIKSSIEDTLGSLQKSITANMIIKMAVAVGILAGSLWLLSRVPTDKIVIATAALGALLYLMSKVTKGSFFSKENVTDTSKTIQLLPSLASNILAVAVAFGVIVHALNSFKKNKINLWDIIKVVILLVSVLGSILAFMWLVKDLKLDDIGKSFGLLITMFAIIGRVGALAKSVKGVPWYTLVITFVGMYALMVAMAKVLNEASRFKKFKDKTILQVAAMILSIGVAVRMIGNTVKSLGKMSVGSMIQGLVGIALLLVGLGVMMKQMSKLDGDGLGQILTTAGGLALLAVAVRLLVGPLRALGKLNWDTLWRGFVAIGTLMLALGVMARMLSTIEPGKMLTSAGSVAILALALDLMLPVLVVLGTIMTAVIAVIPWDKLTKKIGGFFGVFLKLLLLGFAVNLFGKALLSLGTGVLKMGLGMLATTGAVLLFSLAILAVAGAISLLSTSLPQFVESILDTVKVIKERGDEVIELVGVIMVAIAGAMLAKKMEISAAVVELILAVIFVIGARGPEIVDAIWKMYNNIKGTIQGIFYLLGNVLATAFVSLITGVNSALKENEETLSDAFAELIRTIFNVIENTIKKVWSEMSLGEKIASVFLIAVLMINKITGMISGEDGIVSAVDKIKEALTAVAGAAGMSMWGFLGILAAAAAVVGLLIYGFNQIDQKAKTAEKERNAELFGEEDASVEKRAALIPDVIKDYQNKIAERNRRMELDPEGYFEDAENALLDSEISNLGVQVQFAIGELARDIAGTDRGDVYRAVYDELQTAIENGTDVTQTEAYIQYLQRAQEETEALTEKTKALTEQTAELGSKSAQSEKFAPRGATTPTEAVTEAAAQVAATVGDEGVDIPVTPVFDLSNMDTQEISTFFNNLFTGQIAGGEQDIAKMMEQAGMTGTEFNYILDNDETAKNTGLTAQGIAALQQMFGSGFGVYLDQNALVGQLGPGLNQYLGVAQSRSGRGN